VCRSIDYPDAVAFAKVLPGLPERALLSLRAKSSNPFLPQGMVRRDEFFGKLGMTGAGSTWRWNARFVEIRVAHVVAGYPGPSGIPTTYQSTKKMIHTTKRINVYGIMSEMIVPMPASFTYRCATITIKGR
jgi:hypothetical protein